MMALSLYLSLNLVSKLAPKVIMPCQGNQAQAGTWIWIGVEDVGELYEEYKVSGAYKLSLGVRNESGGP